MEDRDELIEEAVDTVTNMLVAATELEDEAAEKLAKKIVRRVDGILSDEADDGDDDEDPET